MLHQYVCFNCCKIVIFFTFLSIQPKYVHQLLKNAAARKLDDERRQERQAHREREKEGDEFGDKEAYITPRSVGGVPSGWCTERVCVHARARVCVCLC